ncbi:MAG: aminomethyl-transferring glycine dehydrogenase subunit GcvPA [Chloroflexi bacterium]|nr:aminomethyl-transferring glycine dehydrogenase subunit GcvPA [Chloroflexota bacterium]
MTIPYLPNTDAGRRAMLDAVGVAGVDDLFADIPAQFRNPRLDLPPALSELELRRNLQRSASRDANTAGDSVFLGGGAYNHFIPSVVWALARRGEFATSYTPYQPELAQGNLQATYEFQSLVCQLLGMDVANAGMYDGASAAAEAALMACRITGRHAVAVLSTVNPRYLDVIRTYATPQGVAVAVVEPGQPPPPISACLIAQSPNFLGYLEPMADLARLAHNSSALLVAITDPISLGLFRPPGEYDADIAVAEGQPLGVPLSFGGPYVGLFACKQAHLRQMPGRVVGKTVDGQGRTGYVLTLQTREQHIRRERATSNICTSETLVAIACAIYLAAMGRHGLREVAELCYHKAHYAAARIAQLPGFSLPIQGTFFKEFVVRCPRAPQMINRALLEQGIMGGLDLGARLPNAMLLCVTEMHSKAEIDALVEGLRKASK